MDMMTYNYESHGTMTSDSLSLDPFELDMQQTDKLHEGISNSTDSDMDCSSATSLIDELWNISKCPE